MNTRSRLYVMLAMAFAFLPASVLALKNPAAVYCGVLGYEYKVEKSTGDERGVCVLEDGRKIDAWQFLQGEVAQDKGYCAIKGYQTKVMRGTRHCLKLMTDSCVFCILPDGREAPVIELIGVSLEETSCGDGTCGIPENHKTCPADCPSASADAYCDAVKDRRCDPDCAPKQDPDCP